MRERGIEITGDLANALERVLGPRLPEPAEVDVLAAYLDWLSRDFGLSGSAPDVSRSERAQPPDAAVAMVKQFVGDESDSELINDQLLGDRLYGVLVALTQDGQSGKILNDTKPLTSVELLQLGQIYWNLEGTDARPKLPIRSGESFAIKVPRANADFATMVWSTRLKNGPDGLRDNSFRIKGARLAVLAAERIVQTKPAPQLEMERAHFRHGDSKNGKGRISAVYWPTPALGIGSAAALSGETPTGDPAINALRQARRDSATAADAADICISILAILERRSVASLGDHEAQLAEEYLQAGLSSVMAGRVDEAIDRFVNAQRVSETLSALTPGATVHKLRLAVALTMRGLLQVQLGQAADAEIALTRAVAISQDLTDSDADNEDMLALALSMLGVHYLQSDRTQDAETTLRRAVVISEKLSTRNPDDYENQLQFANTLTALGGLYMQAEKEKDAEGVLIRAVAVSRHLTTQKADEVSHLLLASALLLLGTHYLSIEREHEAEDALTGSISVSQELFTQDSEEVTRHHPPAKATDLLGGALYLLGVLYLFSDREQEAEDAFTRVVAVFRDRSQDLYDGSLLASTLDSLAELYRMQGRVEDLEKSLALRQRLSSQGGDEPAGI